MAPGCAWGVPAELKALLRHHRCGQAPLQGRGKGTVSPGLVVWAQGPYEASTAERSGAAAERDSSAWLSCRCCLEQALEQVLEQALEQVLEQVHKVQGGWVSGCNKFSAAAGCSWIPQWQWALGLMVHEAQPRLL